MQVQVGECLQKAIAKVGSGNRHKCRSGFERLTQDNKDYLHFSSFKTHDTICASCVM